MHDVFVCCNDRRGCRFLREERFMWLSGWNMHTSEAGGESVGGCLRIGFVKGRVRQAEVVFRVELTCRDGWCSPSGSH